LRGSSGGGPRARVCLTLIGTTLGENLQLVRRLRQYVGLVELRADFLHASQLGGIAAFARQVALPAILTVRRRRDGGVYTGSERERIGILRHGLAGPFQFVDLESDLPDSALLPPPATTVVRSFHDTVGTPHNLDLQAAACARNPAEVPKIAVLARTVRELRSLISVGRRLRRPHIVLAMGDFGVPTRLLAQRLGSMLTYSSAGATLGAPGHLDPVQLARDYRVATVGPETAVFGIAGSPVLHSRSPRIHNAGFRHAGRDAIYVPLLGERLDILLEISDWLGVRGLSVTIPHKEAAAASLSHADETVTATGACNTLLRREDGWHGFNTDVAGFIAPLEARGQPRASGGGALVVGAGGVARAAVYALRRAGMRVLVAGRSPARAMALAQQFDAEWVSLTDTEFAAAAHAYRDLIVQASSAGMHPQELIDPIAPLPLSGTEVVYDLVYSPALTPLMKRAQDSGCVTIGGMEMLLAQAYAQFRLFVGEEYPESARTEIAD
jgi:3-dehydroquinate dehydratase/shikimate dehydrogenase